MTAPTVCALPSPDDQHARFLALAPRIELHARVAFRHLRCPQKKDDAIAETLAVAWKWYVPLIKRGKDPALFVATFAVLAARHVKNGRRVCGQENSKDVMSGTAQHRHAFTVSSLPSSTSVSFESLYADPRGQAKQDAFEERLRDNTRTPPDEQAIFRIDFPAWRLTHTERDRRVIDSLMVGERTRDVARKFGTTAGRISQLRREFFVDSRVLW